MSILYYLPSELSKLAKDANNKGLLEYCEIFNILGKNALILDRTNTLPNPCKTTNLFPIPDNKRSIQLGLTFTDICFLRAEELISSGKPLVLLYSGGIDSTVVLLSLHSRLRPSERYRLTIATTPFAIRENPWAWSEIILPNYKVVSSVDVVSNFSTDGVKYIQGENADQLFGSDKIFDPVVDINEIFNKDVLTNYLQTKTKNVEMFHLMFMELVSKAPFEIELFREFLWWVNFSCKWQGVALRTLSMSGAIKDSCFYDLDVLNTIVSFFNTEDFQVLAMDKQFSRFGTSPSKYNYKQESRNFIRSLTNWDDYITSKVKFGSLWNVSILTSMSTGALRIDDRGVFSSKLSIDDCNTGYQNSY